MKKTGTYQAYVLRSPNALYVNPWLSKEGETVEELIERVRENLKIKEVLPGHLRGWKLVVFENKKIVQRATFRCLGL